MITETVNRSGRVCGAGHEIEGALLRIIDQRNDGIQRISLAGIFDFLRIIMVGIGEGDAGICDRDGGEAGRAGAARIGLEGRRRASLA